MLGVEFYLFKDQELTFMLALSDKSQALNYGRKSVTVQYTAVMRVCDLLYWYVSVVWTILLFCAIITQFITSACSI